MKLWRISQSDNRRQYGVYDSAVVAAETEEDAKTIHPIEELNFSVDDVGVWASLTWVDSSKYVTAEYIGEAAEGTERGVIVASFNAG